MDINMSGGKVTINGKTFECNGSLNIDGNGNVVINGNKVDTIESKIINVVVLGSVGSLQNTSGNVIIEGNVSEGIKTVSGDVRVNGKITGNVQTVSGDVKSESISGNVKTVSGNIN